MNRSLAEFTPYARARALVLGATGFIGRAVTRLLSQAGAEVLAGVRQADRAAPIFERCAIRPRAIEVDLAQPAAVAEAVRRAAPDVVFNLAGYGVDPGQRDPALAERINAGLVAQLSELLARLPEGNWPGQRLIHTGSGLEYGMRVGPIHEQLPSAPVGLYAQSKAAGTAAVAAAAHARGLKGIVVRLFTVYGPGERAGRLLPALLEARRRGGPLPLREGTPSRDFTYVGDVAEGLLRLGVCSAEPGTVVNLATGRLATVREFTLTAARVLGMAESRLAFGALPPRDEDMTHGPVSIERLAALVGWVPPTGIARGVELTSAADAAPSRSLA